MEEQVKVEQGEQTQVTTQQGETTEQQGKTETDKLIQSERSKAKYEILQQLGVSCVEEAKKKFEIANSLERENSEIKAAKDKALEDLAKVQNDFDSYKKQDLYKSLGIKEEQVKDFEAIVGARVDANHEYSEVAKIVAETYFKGKTTIQTAVETPPDNKPKQRINTYGW